MSSLLKTQIPYHISPENYWGVMATGINQAIGYNSQHVSLAVKITRFLFEK